MADVNLNIDITNTIPLSLSLNPINTTVSINPINVNFSLGSEGGSGGGTVTLVSVASPLNNALTFSNPTTIPSLSIVSTANPTTKFLRADGFWVAPSSGSGTVTSISVSVPAGFNVSPASITTSGTFAITYDPAVKIPPVQLGGAGGTATTFLNGLGNWVTPAGAGTVTSVDLTMPAAFRVSGNPVTGAGTLAVAYGTGTIPPANLGFNAPTAGTYLQGNGSWTALTIPTSWSGTGSATAKLAYALPAVSGTQTGSFQQLSFADLSGAPFTLTTSGSSGAATFTAGTLNIPQYSGGGGGGSYFNWSSVASIPVGGGLMAATNQEVIPGASKVFDGAVGHAGALQVFRTIKSNTWYQVNNYKDNLRFIANGTAATNGPLATFDGGLTYSFSLFNNGTNNSYIAPLTDGWIGLGASTRNTYRTTTNLTTAVASGTLAGFGTTIVTDFYNLNNIIVALQPNITIATSSGNSSNTISFTTGVATTINPLKNYWFYSALTSSYWLVTSTNALQNSASLSTGYTTINGPWVAASEVVYGAAECPGANSSIIVFTNVSIYRAASASPTTFTKVFDLTTVTVNDGSYSVAAGATNCIAGANQSGFIISNDGGQTWVWYDGPNLNNAEVPMGLKPALSYLNDAWLSPYAINLPTVLTYWVISILRMPDLRSLYVYSPVSVNPQTAPNGTYQCFGSCTADYETNALWVRTA